MQDNTQNLLAMTSTQAGTVFDKKGFPSNVLFMQMAAAGMLQNPLAQAAAPATPTKGDVWLNTSGTAAGPNPTTAGIWNRHDGNAFVAFTPLAYAADVPTGALLPISDWNADTNTPDLTTAAQQVTGHLYRVATAGTTDLDGETDWQVGDQVWRGEDGEWHKIDNSEAAAPTLTFLTV